MQRYKQIEILIAYEKPEIVLEVGTWNGGRAVAMRKAFPYGKYYGFDLFEQATNITDREEFNVKAHYGKQAVSRLLDEYGINHELFIGNTRKTLPEFLKAVGENYIDFAYIDGGHSVETIRSDYENVLKLVKPGSLIVFDDFYSHMPHDFIQRFGCNTVIKDYHLLPIQDPVKGGGTVQLAITRKENEHNRENRRRNTG